MALVVLVSAKGAPGVTTLTVALAALTPGAVAADLDPDGGDLGLRYRRPDGAPLDTDLGVLSLANGLRRDLPGPRWQPQPEPAPRGSASARLEDHLQVTGGGLDLLLGVTGPEQAAGLGPLWSPLARALSEAGRTVYADCGRVGPAAPTMPVVHQADAVIVVARPELEELAHLRERLRFLNTSVPGRFAGRAQIGVVLVAPERDRAVAGRTEQLLHSSGVGVPVLGTMALDQRGAEALRGMNRSRLNRSTLIRSVRSLLPSVSLLAGTIPELSHPQVVVNAAAARAQATPPAPPRAQPSAPEEPAPVPPVAAPAPAWPEPARTPLRPVPAEPPAHRPFDAAPEEQTLPLRRHNSFFGDALPVDEDPSLQHIQVAPGVFTTSAGAGPQNQLEDDARTDASPLTSRPVPGEVRGFAGLTTPPGTAPDPLDTSGTRPIDELRHTRSRRAAAGRDPGPLPASERRRARRHRLPTEDSETGYGMGSSDSQNEGNPAVGNWLQDRRSEAPDTVAPDKQAWSALRDWATQDDDRPAARSGGAPGDHLRVVVDPKDPLGLGDTAARTAPETTTPPGNAPGPLGNTPGLGYPRSEAQPGEPATTGHPGPFDTLEPLPKRRPQAIPDPEDLAAVVTSTDPLIPGDAEGTPSSPVAEETATSADALGNRWSPETETETSTNPPHDHGSPDETAPPADESSSTGVLSRPDELSRPSALSRPDAASRSDVPSPPSGEDASPAGDRRPTGEIVLPGDSRPQDEQAAKPHESRGFSDRTRPPAERAEGTGWIAPDMPPARMSSPVRVPVVGPSTGAMRHVAPAGSPGNPPPEPTWGTPATTTSAGGSGTPPEPNRETHSTTASADDPTRTIHPTRESDPATPTTTSTGTPTTENQPAETPAPKPFYDRTAILRDIRDRARQGADGTGTWAGHSGNTGSLRQVGNPGPRTERTGPGAIVRALRDPYEPADAPLESPAGEKPSAGAPNPSDSPQDQGDEPAGGR
ncbi:hypothetical protein [Kineosporia succinea]|uniref:MinD-like ATPase involved in chromosome partitioning or flagellar assembly n=1 Tax=Kineosporia succinea TaxID=84632 RepID=A0ABT9P568_9ACTN|nr:hypothetical protein [Kineosporia succinea]MDP9827701.1 hypothetical protein [Kineosporia succinea]